MIPVRVSLRNFLSFATAPDGGPAVLDFEGSPLWTISGDNGAGKTAAISDALTYVLYGQHRGGRQGDTQLVHQGATTAEVEVVFDLGDHRYRVRRTIQRPARPGRAATKTCAAATWDTTSESWQPVPDTNSASELRAWAVRSLGMELPTFVASTLLVQGKGDALLTAEPRERFAVLGGLLDLSPYQWLAEEAGRREREAKAEVSRLDGTLAQLTPVSDEELAEADQVVAEHQTAISGLETAAREAVERAERARAYLGILERHAEVEAHIHRLSELEEQATALAEAEAARATLAAQLPRLAPAGAAITRGLGCATKLAALEVQLAAIDLAALEQQARDARDAETGLSERLSALKEEMAANRDEAALLRPAAERLRERDDADATLVKHGTPVAWQTQLELAQFELAAFERDVIGPARDRYVGVTNARSAEQARLELARDGLAARDAAGAEGICSRCGQPVTPEHLARERATLATEITARERSLAELDEQLECQSMVLEGYGGEVARRRQALLDLELGCERARSLAEQAATARQHWNTALTALEEAAPTLGAWIVGATAEAAAERVRARAEMAADLGRQVEALAPSVKEIESTAKIHEQTYSTAADNTRTWALTIEAGQRELAMLHELEVAALADISEPWRSRLQAGDDAVKMAATAELDQLTLAAAPYAELEQSRRQKEGWIGRRAQVQEQIAATPEADRLAPEMAAKAAETAEEIVRQRRQAKEDAVNEAARLRTIRERRVQLTEEAGQAGQRQRRYRQLAALLGRNGIQAMLLTEALQGIERLANEALEVLSGGSLALRLRQETDEIAILAVDRSSGDEARDACYLSGGQRFRAAVALALGIGRHLGRGAGAVRALIIDEGFGALDSDGRRGMIDELQRLTASLDRVLFVSHQEDLLDRVLFPNGYRLRKGQNGTVIELVG